MTFELLWTDKCFLALLSLGFILVLLSLRQEQIRRSFSLILHRPLALSAGIFLCVFLMIGILDSIHFRLANNGSDATADSVLDRILFPIGDVDEKTYSAPLALNLSVSETQLEKGVTTQVYPRLVYPPSILKTEQDKQRVIKECVTHSSFYSIFLVLSLWLLGLIIRYSIHKQLIFRFSPATISTLITVLVLSFFLILGYSLSRYFHVFGTGQIGQDIFYFSLKSIRTGLIIGLLTTLFMLPLAVFLGIAAGYFGGIVDDVIQYIYTTLSSIPGVLLITASVLSLQTYITSHPDQFTTLAQSADARLLALCFILGVTSWTSLCRLLRAETLKLREIDYV